MQAFLQPTTAHPPLILIDHVLSDVVWTSLATSVCVCACVLSQYRWYRRVVSTWDRSWSRFVSQSTAFLLDLASRPVETTTAGMSRNCLSIVWSIFFNMITVIGHRKQIPTRTMDLYNAGWLFLSTAHTYCKGYRYWNPKPQHENRNAGGGSLLGDSGRVKTGWSVKQGNKFKIGSTGKQGRKGQIRIFILEFAGEIGGDTQDNLAEDKWKWGS